MYKRLAVLLGLLMAACSAGSSFGPPDTLDSGTFSRVDRTVEDQLMNQGAAVLGGQGLQEPFGAAYEFIHYKPQFFLGAGRGSASPQALIDAVLPLFGGKPGLSEPAHEVTRDGGTFLCGPYSHTGVPGTVGTGGLASIAAICAWSDGGTAGFGVGVAGPSVDDVVGLTAEARADVNG